MPWATNKPSDYDFVRDVAKQWRQDKKSLTSYFDSFVYTSEASAGFPIDTGRILAVDTQSQVSSRNRVDLIYNLDEDELVYLDSAGSQVRIGSGHAIHSALTSDANNLPSMALNCKNVVEYGTVTSSNANKLQGRVTFKHTYATLPRIFVCSSSTQPGVSSAASFMVGYMNSSTTGFTCVAQFVTPTSTSTVNDIMWRWRSVGTVAL